MRFSVVTPLLVALIFVACSFIIADAATASFNKNIQLSENPNPSVTYDCSNNATKYVHPTDCTRYCVCWENKENWIRCDQGYVFNASSLTCTNSKLDPNICGDRVNTWEVTPPPTPPSYRLICYRPNGLFAIKGSCGSSFVSCYDGYPTEMKCYNGLRFNPANCQCDWQINIPRTSTDTPICRSQK